MRTWGRVTILLVVVWMMSMVAALSIHFTGAQNPAAQNASSVAAVSPTGSVEVLGAWKRADQDGFKAMVAPWEQQTGGQMSFTGEADIITVLNNRIQAGDPPDIAILPDLRYMRTLVDADHLVPLNDLLDVDRYYQDYPGDWIKVSTYKYNLYAVPVKAANKGIMWYDPQVFAQNKWRVPQTYDFMITLANSMAAGQQVPEFPFSIGAEKGEESGVPIMELMAQIFLSENGPDIYDDWVNHQIPWDDPRIRAAWDKMSQMVYTSGYTPNKAAGVRSTNYLEAAFLPFRTPPRAAMHFGGDYVQRYLMAEFPGQTPLQDYAFFTFPAVNSALAGPEIEQPPQGENPAVAPLRRVPLIAAADLIVVLRDTPAVRSFIEYVSTAQAQQIWVERGGFISVNKNVNLDAYSNQLVRRSAEALVTATAIRFFAGDLMPPAIRNAWRQLTLDYLHNSHYLHDKLQQMEAWAVAAYPQQ